MPLADFLEVAGPDDMRMASIISFAFPRAALSRTACTLQALATATQARTSFCRSKFFVILQPSLNKSEQKF